MPNGTLAVKRASGLSFSPDGKRLYLTDGGPALRQFDPSNGAELVTVTVPGARRLMEISSRGKDLCIANSDGAEVFHFALDESDQPEWKETIPGADSPLGVALSSDGLQLFTAGHYTGIIGHFRYDEQAHAWALMAKIKAPGSLGFALVQNPHSQH